METLSSDAVVHDLLGDEAVRAKLVERWGEEIAGHGGVDRGRVGEIVFADPGELAWLEQTLHPLVGERVAAWAGELPPGTRFAAVEVPLLFEAGMEDFFDATVAVVADEGVRRSRAAERGHALIDERTARQLGQDEKAARADHVVPNDGTREELAQKLSALLESLQT